jgi:serine/threonine protein kinase
MVGTTIKHYEIGSKLGEGGMGAVYRARDTRLDRAVAFKVLKPALVADPESRHRFVREARSAAATTHAAIAQIYDVDEQDGTIFIAMEFVEGRTLRQLIADKELDLQSALDIATQVAEGLANAHAKGIVHRDIKSDNIMVTPEGQAKILDFGLAKALDPLDRPHRASEDATAAPTAETMAQTQLGVVMGTIAYMSPEQARGRPVDQTTDLFSLGIVIYEMVTSKLPFHGESPLDTMHAIAFDEVPAITEVRVHLPADLHRIVSRCLRKQPADRYQDARSLADDLRRLRRDLDSGVQRTLPAGERLREGLDWLRNAMPIGRSGLAATVGLLLLIVWLLVSEAGTGRLVTLTIVGLLIYRWVRNRRARMLRRFVARVRSMPEVRAIVVRETRITVVVDRTQAKVYMRVNRATEMVNGKLFQGAPFESAVRDDMTEAELAAMLREPGVVYVRKDMLAT